ncbi:MAG: tetratricopeptide repeat protein, partial [Bacteroidales bacterium]|nr:tetratricopeptide repeat protein [Bacteroidales bacterium]
MQNTKFHIVALCAILLAQVAVGQSSQSLDAQRAEFRRAKDLFEKEKYSSSQHAFEKYILNNQNKNDDNVESAYFYSAVCAQLLSNLDAQVKLENFIRMYPQSAHVNMAHLFLGNHFYSERDYKSALEQYRMVDESLIEYGYRSEYDFKMGYCLFDAGRYREAQKLFAQQVGGKSKYAASSLYYYAHIQYMQGEYEPALRNFRELQKDRRFTRIVPSYIARIYYYLGREDELLQMAPQLLQDEETFRRDEIRQMIGEVYFNRGEYARALEQYRAVAQGNDDGAGRCTPQDNDYQIGYCYYQLGNYDSAAAYLVRKTVCSDSVAQNALYLLADCYLKNGRKSDARSMFLQASKMDFDPKIKEESLFNYAKLGCELKQN